MSQGKPRLLLSSSLAPIPIVTRAEAIMPYNLPPLPVSESLRKIVTDVVVGDLELEPQPLPKKTGFMRYVYSCTLYSCPLSSIFPW